MITAVNCAYHLVLGTSSPGWSWVFQIFLETAEWIWRTIKWKIHFNFSEFFYDYGIIWKRDFFISLSEKVMEMVTVMTDLRLYVTFHTHFPAVFFAEAHSLSLSCWSCCFFFMLRHYILTYTIYIASKCKMIIVLINID